MKDDLIERGSVIGDVEGELWRVLEATDEGLFMLKLPERHDVVHTRSVSWRQFANFGYELVFP